MGVVRMYRYVVVRRYIDILIIIITFPYSTCISSFWAAASIFLGSFFKMFFHSCLCYFCATYSKRCSKTVRDRSKIEMTRIELIIIIDK